MEDATYRGTIMLHREVADNPCFSIIFIESWYFSNSRQIQHITLRSRPYSLKGKQIVIIYAAVFKMLHVHFKPYPVRQTRVISTMQIGELNFLNPCSSEIWTRNLWFVVKFLNYYNSPQENLTTIWASLFNWEIGFKRFFWLIRQIVRH